MIGQPLTEAEIAQLAREAGGVALLLSRKSPKYRVYAKTAVSDTDWIKAMALEPRLIRRPIWRVAEGRLLIGFDEPAWSQALAEVR